MIISFEHKGLALFFKTGSVSGIQPIHANRLRVMLSVLQTANAPSDLNRPSWRLHALSGNLKGYLSLSVQANWRLTFRFLGPDVELLNYCDYH
jgi:proteic killer suppression protein